MTTPHDEIRVLVVADDHLARAGLAALLAERPGCVVVGQADGAEHLSAGHDLYRADVVVWDLGWDAAEVLEQLTSLADSEPPTVVLTADEAHAADAWAAGARGVLPRDTDSATLMNALLAVSEGLAVFDPGIAAAPRVHSDPPARAEVTPRELDVLNLMAEGLPNKTIARHLSISEHTVKFHVNAVLSKLGAHSRTEAVTRATRMGLIAL